MKKLILLPLFLLFVSLAVRAQIGFSAGWVQHDAAGWNDRLTEMSVNDETFTVFKQSGAQIGVDYWFRLKNKRIEFLPELSFYQMKASANNIRYLLSEIFSSEMTANIFQLHFNTQIYPFDFAGDCDCPTFSKDGDVFKKGLFIRLAPGLSYGSFKDTQDNIRETTDTNFDPTVRAGIGLDIGISDFLTVTPIIQYTRTFSTGGFRSTGYWDGAPYTVSDIDQLYFGLRLGMRFDELNKYGYR